jgi:hypothetical protein
MTPSEPPDKSATSTAQERRAQALRRAFQRTLGHKPTTLQRTLMDRAAIMTARAEIAAADPATSANDCVRLDGAAARARAAMFEAIAAGQAKSKRLGPDSLRAYAASKYSVPA